MYQGSMSADSPAGEFYPPTEAGIGYPWISLLLSLLLCFALPIVVARMLPTQSDPMVSAGFGVVVGAALLISGALAVLAIIWHSVFWLFHRKRR
jgi:hypothetical protein